MGKSNYLTVLFRISFFMLCLTPNPIRGHRATGSKLLHANDDWTNWLKYIHETSDLEDSPDVVDSLVADDIVNNSSVGWRSILVAQDGTGDFTTISEAVDSVPKYNTVPTVISIQAGIYREKVVIPRKKQYITLIGDKDRTIVVWNDTAATIGPKNLPLRTFHSATVAISSKHFVAKYIIFKNDAPPPVPGQIGGQAVALRVSSDNAAFYGCKFYGHQDTLYDHKGRHYFKDCFIEGSIDFIFGNGRSLYKNCELHVLSVGYVGSVTAQKRNQSSLDTGFSFVQCNLTGNGTVYLGRAWGIDSRVVFAFTWMDNIIVPEGWNNWGVASRERTVFYAEYDCTGPGANRSSRVPWARLLTDEEAKPFLTIGFINGKAWLQQV